MYAIVKDRGRQYRVREGDLVRVDLVSGEAGRPGERFRFGEVLLCSDGEDVRVGTPSLTGVNVEAVVEESPVKGKKLRSFKKFQNQGQVHKGHRQKYTLVRVKKIKPPGAKEKR